MARSSTTFQAGPDKRRHKFTRRERKRGYHNAVGWIMRGDAPPPGARDLTNDEIAYIYYKVRAYYRGQA